MGIFVAIGGGSKELNTGVVTQVLNSDECGYVGVGVNLNGQLFYRKPWKLRGESDIRKVIFIHSAKVSGRVPRHAVSADFDIHTYDGNIIEVHTEERAIIEAAMKHAPQTSLRDKLRRRS